MTYAPQTLLDARAYLAEKTGLPWVSLGIVGSAGHHRSGTSYHIGWSHLQEWAYSRQHPRDTKLRTEAASALDIGQWSAAGLRALTAHMLAEARDGRLPDVRDLIGPAADGRAYRWDRHDSWRGRLRASGDSHETHCHISYYRDSEHRPKVEPFRDFFEGDDDMIDRDDVDRIWNMDDVVRAPAGYTTGNDFWSPSTVIRSAQQYARAAWAVAKANEAKLDLALSGASGLTVEQIQAATAAALREVLGSLDEPGQEPA